MQKVPGYAGKILYVDLSRDQVKEETLDPDLIKNFLGGHGINLKLASELISPEVDPLSAENKIIIGAGPFNSTCIPGGAKIQITTKYPLNGAISRGSGGGAFGLMLKSCGYDHVVIGGKAKHPVYLQICEGRAQICAAQELWGKDIYTVVDLLSRRHEPCSVIPIGQAGENLVKISLTTIDKCGSVGRGGLPAVMGAKNLKAIVACRGRHEVEVADYQGLVKTVNRLLERIQKWPGRQLLLEQGMSSQSFLKMEREPKIYDHWTKGYFAGQEEIQSLLADYQASRKPLACPACPLAEKDCVWVEKGGYAGAVFYGDHLVPVDDEVERFGKAVHYSALLNSLGIDRVDFHALVSLVVALFNKGIITRADLDGLAPKERDYETNVKLLEMVAFRRGIGTVLAEGLVKAASVLGKDALAHVYHVKGLSPLYDPRARGFLGTMEFTQFTNPRGAHVAFGGSPAYDPGRSLEDFRRHAQRMGVPDEAYESVFGPDSFNVGRLSRYSEDWCSLFDCLGLCNRAFMNRFYHVQTISELYAALTGNYLAPAQLMKIAERVWNLWRILNVNCGFGRKDDCPPDAWYTPLQGKEKKFYLYDYYRTRTFCEQDVQGLLDDYYAERGWDKESGAPTARKIKELGLESYLLQEKESV